MSPLRSVIFVSKSVTQLSILMDPRTFNHEHFAFWYVFVVEITWSFVSWVRILSSHLGWLNTFDTFSLKL